MFWLYLVIAFGSVLAGLAVYDLRQRRRGARGANPGAARRSIGDARGRASLYDRGTGPQGGGSI